MAGNRGTGKPSIGTISLLLALFVYTVVFSVLSGHFVSPMEGKGFGFIVILFLYAVFKLILGLVQWMRGRGQKPRGKTP